MHFAQCGYYRNLLDFALYKNDKFTTKHRSEKSWKQFFSILSICLVEVAFTKFLWKNVRVNFRNFHIVFYSPAGLTLGNLGDFDTSVSMTFAPVLMEDNDVRERMRTFQPSGPI